MPVNIEVEEAPVGLQRMWNQARARSVGTSCPSDISDTLETFEPIQQTEEKLDDRQLHGCSDPESDFDDLFDDQRLASSLASVGLGPRAWPGECLRTIVSCYVDDQLRWSALVPMTCQSDVCFATKLPALWKFYLCSIAFTRAIHLVQQFPSIANSLLDRLIVCYHTTHPEDRDEQSRRFQKWRSREPLVLEASTLGDFPAFYEIAPLLPHQFPVIGVYIDKRVNVGFRYKVKPLSSWDVSSKSKKPSYLFHGRALKLLSIGRGYSRRFTFEPVDSTLNNNENYFWGDSRPEGFAFEIEVVSVGDKFTVFDLNDEAQGTLEIVQLQKDQMEQEQSISKDGSIEKKVEIYALCKVEWYERSREIPLVPIMGIALVNKPTGKSTSTLVKIFNVTIGAKRAKRGYELRPGVQSSLRRTTVIGKAIGDVPTKYSIVGLENYEFPVIGTYVDTRIVAGFHYRVRSPDSKRHFFNGRSLLLESIGRGYGKRLSFTPDNFNNPENYFWSDSHSSGVGLEPRAVHTGMKFAVIANNEHLGEATVFRADMPQVEEKMEIIPMPGRNKNAVEKHIQIDVTCHVKLATTGGGSVDSQVHLMRVSGVALVRKDPDSPKARLLKVYDVGLDSQLNQLFVQSQTELTFLHIGM